MGETTALLGATGIHSELKELAVTLANLKDLWSVTTAKPQVEIDIKMVNPERHEGWRVDRVKAQIVIVLGCMSEDINWKSVYANLKVYQNPWAVVAKKDFDLGELVLVPATQNVKARLPTDKLPDKAIDLGALTDTMHFHLMPQ